MKAEDMEVADEVLQRAGQRFALLDKRLSAALQKGAHGGLGREITQAAEMPSRKAVQSQAESC